MSYGDYPPNRWGPRVRDHGALSLSVIMSLLVWLQRPPPKPETLKPLNPKPLNPKPEGSAFARQSPPIGRRRDSRV